jgi:predicted anti-sigma-YlaC factor YlaD
MTCSACRAALSACLDGEPHGLPPGTAGWERHLSGCVRCQDWLAAAARLRRLSRHAPGPSLEWSQGLLAGLLQRRAHDGPATGTA